MGEIDEVQVYNRALTAQETANIYNAGSGGICDTIAPTVMATIPVNSMTSVAPDTTIIAAFSEAMLVSSITSSTFLLAGPSGQVAGSIFAGYTVAVLTPLFVLASGTTYTATITTGARDLAGNALVSAHSWTFTIDAGGCIPLASGAAAWWPGNGNADDAIGSSNGTLVSGATFTTGMVGQSFSLDGVDDHVNMGTDGRFNFGTRDFTVGLWVRYASVNGEQVPW